MRILKPTLVLFTAWATACGDGADCVALPCALPVAVALTVTSAASGAPVDGATLRLTNIGGSEIPCDASTCVVMGEGGTYEIDISAPGFQTTHRSVKVSSHQTGRCGCPVVDEQHVSVALTPVA